MSWLANKLDLLITNRVPCAGRSLHWFLYHNAADVGLNALLGILVHNSLGSGILLLVIYAVILLLVEIYRVCTFVHLFWGSLVFFVGVIVGATVLIVRCLSRCGAFGGSNPCMESMDAIEFLWAALGPADRSLSHILTLCRSLIRFADCEYKLSKKEFNGLKNGYKNLVPISKVLNRTTRRFETALVMPYPRYGGLSKNEINHVKRWSEKLKEVAAKLLEVEPLMQQLIVVKNPSRTAEPSLVAAADAEMNELHQTLKESIVTLCNQLQACAVEASELTTRMKPDSVMEPPSRDDGKRGHYTNPGQFMNLRVRKLAEPEKSKQKTKTNEAKCAAASTTAATTAQTASAAAAAAATTTASDATAAQMAFTAATAATAVSTQGNNGTTISGNNNQSSIPSASAGVEKSAAPPPSLGAASLESNGENNAEPFQTGRLSISQRCQRAVTSFKSWCQQIVSSCRAVGKESCRVLVGPVGFERLGHALARAKIADVFFIEDDGVVLKGKRGNRIDFVYLPCRAKYEELAMHRKHLEEHGADGTAASQFAESRAASVGTVLFCSPNAAVYENLSEYEEDKSWYDFYTVRGFDVVLWNYSGYGRSSGIPTPSRVKSDVEVLCHYLRTTKKVQNLIIHGSSIGGMIAAHAARVSGCELLVCDRTFTKLSCVAERMFDSWSRVVKVVLDYAAGWHGTHVAADYLAFRGPKVILQDPIDRVIDNDASLKSGVASWLVYGDRQCHIHLSPWSYTRTLANGTLNYIPPHPPRLFRNINAKYHQILPTDVHDDATSLETLRQSSNPLLRAQQDYNNRLLARVGRERTCDKLSDEFAEHLYAYMNELIVRNIRASLSRIRDEHKKQQEIAEMKRLAKTGKSALERIHPSLFVSDSSIDANAGDNDKIPPSVLPPSHEGTGDRVDSALLNSSDKPCVPFIGCIKSSPHNSLKLSSRKQHEDSDSVPVPLQPPPTYETEIGAMSAAGPVPQQQQEEPAPSQPQSIALTEEASRAKKSPAECKFIDIPNSREIYSVYDWQLSVKLGDPMMSFMERIWRILGSVDGGSGQLIDSGWMLDHHCTQFRVWMANYIVWADRSSPHTFQCYKYKSQQTVDEVREVDSDETSVVDAVPTPSPTAIASESAELTLADALKCNCRELGVLTMQKGIELCSELLSEFVISIQNNDAEVCGDEEDAEIVRFILESLKIIEAKRVALSKGNGIDVGLQAGLHIRRWPAATPNMWTSAATVPTRQHRQSGVSLASEAGGSTVAFGSNGIQDNSIGYVIPLQTGHCGWPEPDELDALNQLMISFGLIGAEDAV